jgi:hypothetical protein
MLMKLNYKMWIGMFVLVGALFVGAPPAAFSQVSIGIQIGAPPPLQVVVMRPPSPDPVDNAYMWIDGYWYPAEGHYYWHKGYWTRPPYVGAAWVVPHYEGGATTTVATGEVRTGASSTTITGTMTAIATTVAGTKTTASTKAGTKKITTTTIATKTLH